MEPHSQQLCSAFIILILYLQTEGLIRNVMTLSFPISPEEPNTLIHLQIKFQVLLIIQTKHKPKQIKMEISKKKKILNNSLQCMRKNQGQCCLHHHHPCNRKPLLPQAQYPPSSQPPTTTF